MHTVDHPPPSRQRGPHNDPTMLDGDSAHGNPGDAAGDEWAVDTDTDVPDRAAEDELDDAVADSNPEADETDKSEARVGLSITTTTADEEETDDETAADEEREGDEPEEVEEDDGVTEPDAAAKATTAPPIDGYDALTVPQVVERAGRLDAGQLKAVLEYEQANRNRKTLVAKLTRLTRDD